MEWQIASGHFFFWIIFVGNTWIFLAPFTSWSIVILHLLLLQWRTLLISFPFYLTFPISQWQWQHNLDVKKSSKSTTSNHKLVFYFLDSSPSMLSYNTFSWTTPISKTSNNLLVFHSCLFHSHTLENLFKSLLLINKCLEPPFLKWVWNIVKGVTRKLIFSRSYTFISHCHILLSQYSFTKRLLIVSNVWIKFIYHRNLSWRKNSIYCVVWWVLHSSSHFFTCQNITLLTEIYYYCLLIMYKLRDNGKSLDSGHCVAEAIDWTMGLCFYLMMKM